jgi:hypothetical protein
MPRPARLLPLGALAACLTLAAACGGSDADPADTSAAAESPAAAEAAVSADAASAADAPITEADIDAYGRALAAEVALLRATIEKRDAARSGEDSLSAMMSASEMVTLPAAAREAGIGEDRYRALEAALGRAIGARLQNPGMLAAMAAPDTSHLAQLPAAEAEQQRAQLRANLEQMQAAWGDSATYASVPPAILDRFKERATAQLDSLWRQRFELRARAAGLGR